MTRFAGSSPQIQSFMSGDFSPRYDEQADIYSKAKSFERQTAMDSEAYTAAAGLDSMGKIASAHHQARGIEAGGMERAAGHQAAGMQGLFGGLAKGIGGMNFGGGASAASVPKVGHGYAGSGFMSA